MPSLRARVSPFSLFALAGLLACGAASTQHPADLVVYGRVWTGDSATHWAQAVAIAADTVVAVGDSATTARLVGPQTRVLSSGRGMVVPGFMDGHTHFMDGGTQLASVDLRAAASPGEFVARLKAYAGRL